MPCAEASRRSSAPCWVKAAARRSRPCSPAPARSNPGRLAAITGVVLLLVAALGVVVQLKDAMNTIWNVEEPKEAGLWWYLRTYLISFAGILGLGFLLAVSLVVSTGLAALSSWSGSAAAVGEAINFVSLTRHPDGSVRHAVQVVSRYRGRLGRCASRSRGHRASVQPRQVRHRLVHRHAGPRIHLRCSRVHRSPAGVGLLLGTDRLVRRRGHACLCRPSAARRRTQSADASAPHKANT